MTDEEVVIANEKRKFKLVFEMLKQIESIDFETDVGKELHADLVVCISEVIRPIIIQKANKFIS